MKKRAKEKATEEKHEFITTGGGPAPSIKYNDEEKRVIEIIGENLDQNLNLIVTMVMYLHYLLLNL